MSKAIDNIKEELKTLYPDEKLTDEELMDMAQNLVKFFEIGIRVLYQDKKECIWHPKVKKNDKKAK